jgi:hypothetical protein
MSKLVRVETVGKDADGKLERGDAWVNPDHVIIVTKDMSPEFEENTTSVVVLTPTKSSGDVAHFIRASGPPAIVARILEGVE